MNKRAQGAKGEERAKAFLQSKGMKPLAQNVYFVGGELDLVMTDGRYIVFVEVKQRSSNRYGAGREAVGHQKQQRICSAAMQYLMREGKTDCPVRFDVVEIQRETFTHIENAFEFRA